MAFVVIIMFADVQAECTITVESSLGQVVNHVLGVIEIAGTTRRQSSSVRAQVLLYMENERQPWLIRYHRFLRHFKEIFIISHGMT